MFNYSKILTFTKSLTFWALMFCITDIASDIKLRNTLYLYVVKLIQIELNEEKVTFANVKI